MHQEQLSLEESWQLSAFSKHNKHGKQGAELGKHTQAKRRARRGCEPRGLGERWGNRNTEGRDRSPGSCSYPQTTHNKHYKGVSQELVNRWGYFHSSSISFCFSSSKSQLQGLERMSEIFSLLIIMKLR